MKVIKQASSMIVIKILCIVTPSIYWYLLYLKHFLDLNKSYKFSVTISSTIDASGVYRSGRLCLSDEPGKTFCSIILCNNPTVHSVYYSQVFQNSVFFSERMYCNFLLMDHHIITISLLCVRTFFHILRGPRS